MVRKIWMIGVLLLAFTKGYGGPSGPPAELIVKFEALRDARLKKDTELVAKLSREFLADPDTIKKVLGPGATPDIQSCILAYNAELAAGDSRKVADLFKTNPEHTVVEVASATTEELLAYPAGSRIEKDFTQAWHILAADRILAPGITWYAVTIHVPGGVDGYIYPLFFNVAGQWKTLHSIWRPLRERKLMRESNY